MDGPEAAIESGWRESTMAVPRAIGEVEREVQRLDAATEQLAEQVTALFDRFTVALDSTERPDNGERLAHPAVNTDLGRRLNTDLGRRLSSMADVLERQIERLQELRSRCEL